MLGLRRKKPKTDKVAVKQDKLYLVIDVGTEFIKTAVCKINQSNKVEIIGYDRTPQKVSSMRSSMIINLDEVVNTVDIAIGNALNHAEQRMDNLALPDTAIIGIAGELVKSFTLVVNYEREDAEENITADEIDDVFAQIKEQAYEDAKVAIADEINLSPDALAEIHTSLNSTEIDGTHVTNPLGFTGSQITYKIYTAFAPKLHINALQQMLERLDLKQLELVVAPYALATGAKNARLENFSGIFIDVGGGTTDIAVVDHGAVIGTNMFGLGGRAFTKRIAKDLNLDFLAAEQKKLDYSDQKLSDKEIRQISKILQSDVKVWAEAVAIGLSEFEHSGNFPSKVYVSGGGAMLPDIMTGLLEYPWLQTLPFDKFPKFNFILPNQIEDVVDLTRSVTDPRDVMPLALARFLLNSLEK